MSPSVPSSPAEADPTPRILFLQNSSIFEGYGGIEYYQDDFLCLASEAFPGATLQAVVPQRTDRLQLTTRPYAVEVVRFSSNRWLQKFQNRFSLHYFREARERAEAIRPTLLVAGHIALAPLTALLARELRLPFAVIAYGIEIWGDLWPQESWALQHASGILSISHWTKRILVERGYKAERIQVVQPSLPAEYENVPQATRARAPGDPLVLLTVSRLDAREQYKGQDHVLHALHRLRLTDPKASFRYIIQGDGTDRLRLQKLALSLELKEVVEFRRPVHSREALKETYQEADLFVMPSRFGRWDKRWRGEGFGIVYLEAAAFGLPSVAYDCGGATDIIRHGENGMLVDPDNIAELARTLLHLSQQRKLLEELGARARTRVARDFTRAAIRTQMKDALSFFHP